MATPLSPEEEKTFETLWARFTMQPEICAARWCKEPLQELAHAVTYGAETEHTCSLPCAIKLSKEKEKTSTHIKVVRLDLKKK